MEAVVLRALKRHPRAVHLREPVTVVGLHPEAPLELHPHVLRPGFRPEYAGLECIKRLSHRFGHFGEVEGVTWRAVDGGHPEVLDHLDLAAGVSRCARDHRHADLLGAVVEPETAGEEAVVDRVLKDIVYPETDHRHIPRYQVRPVVEILPGVADDGRFPRRAGCRVNPDDLFHGDCKEAERVSCLELLFVGERELLHIVKRPDIVGRYARFPELSLV
ncbi:hypothetical protein DSECCO2_490890 [anaerobic digester metagenome]